MVTKKKNIIKKEPEPILETVSATEEGITFVEAEPEEFTEEEKASLLESLEEAKTEPAIPFVPEPVGSQPSDIVKVRVVLGSVATLDARYSKGDIFETTRELAESIDPRFVRIVG